MITDVEMEAMGIFISEISKRTGLEQESKALEAMQDTLADLDTERFYSSSDEEKAAFMKPFVDAITENKAIEERKETTWICVYKDAVCRHAAVDNLVYIEVPSDWLLAALAAEFVSDVEGWFDEYTADSTDNIARKAVIEGVILNCDDEYAMNSIRFHKENPELVSEAEKVGEFIDSFKDYEDIPDDLGFEFNGMFIKDPFYDESARFEVDPFIYYGVDNMKAYLEKAKRVMSKEPDKPLEDVIKSCEKVSKENDKLSAKSVERDSIVRE